MFIVSDIVEGGGGGRATEGSGLENRRWESIREFESLLLLPPPFSLLVMFSKHQQIFINSTS